MTTFFSIVLLKSSDFPSKSKWKVEIKNRIIGSSRKMQFGSYFDEKFVRSGSILYDILLRKK